MRTSCKTTVPQLWLGRWRPAEGRECERVERLRGAGRELREDRRGFFLGGGGVRLCERGSCEGAERRWDGPGGS
jgi:hypothetical protein